MEKLIITGQKPLRGEVAISGSKNAAVGVIAAALLADDVVVLENVPDIADTQNLIKIMGELKVKVEQPDRHTLRIDSRTMVNCCLDSEPVHKMRASYYFLGVLLGRFHEARVGFPGGCDFGARPIDYHIKGFEALGAEVCAEQIVSVKAQRLTGTSIYLDFPSVGATINIMLAAVLAEGTTVIENAAREPHVVDTANILSAMGANVKGAGTSTITETIFDNRFRYVEQLLHLGANIEVSGHSAIIQGVDHLHGGSVSATDLRGGVAMVLAGLAAVGRTTLTNIHFIDRGYEDMVKKLTELGARIERV